MIIWDQACEIMPCEHKLHQVMFLLISLALNVVYPVSVNFRVIPIKFCISATYYCCVSVNSWLLSYDRTNLKNGHAVFVLTWLIFTGPCNHIVYVLFNVGAIMATVT